MDAILCTAIAQSFRRSLGDLAHEAVSDLSCRCIEVLEADAIHFLAAAEQKIDDIENSSATDSPSSCSSGEGKSLML